MVEMSPHVHIFCIQASLIEIKARTHTISHSPTGLDTYASNNKLFLSGSWDVPSAALQWKLFRKPSDSRLIGLVTFDICDSQTWECVRGGELSLTH